MTRRTAAVTGALVLTLLLMGPFGAARAQAPAQPSRWVADWGERRCAIMRSAPGATPATLSLRLIPGQRIPELLLVDPAWTQEPFFGERRLTVILAPSGEHVSARGIVAPLEAHGPKMLQVYDVGESFLDRLAQSSALIVQLGDRRLAEFPLPQATAAVRALRACNRFTVELDGHVSDCAIVVSSGNGSLDDSACRILLDRGRFEPALGPDGRPVRMTTVSNLDWVVPGGQAHP
jgi:hypothetical protein